MDRVNHILKNDRYQKSLQKIKEYEKQRMFCRHDIEHFMSVARIMRIKSLEDEIKIEKDMIYAVALLHDIGRALQYEKGQDHASAGEVVARSILEECGYLKEEIEEICRAITTHNGLEGNSPLGCLLQFADKISRNCFFCSASKECHWPEMKKNRGVII